MPRIQDGAYIAENPGNVAIAEWRFLVPRSDSCVFSRSVVCVVKMHGVTKTRRVIAQRCFIPLVGYGTRVAGRLGQPNALAVALSFLPLAWAEMPKTSFRKNSDSPQGIKKFDEAIERVALKHADYSSFSTLPGAGSSLAPRLLVAFGEDSAHYRNAADLQKYSGVAPVTERSGKKHWVHWRWQCPTFLRQTFTEWAAQTINKSFWAGQYYYQQRSKGCTYQAAVRALAYKWIRILYRCWQTGKPYNESTYLKALERRGSTLLKQTSVVTS